MHVFVLLLIAGGALSLGADPPDSVPASGTPGFRIKTLPEPALTHRPQVRPPFSDAEVLNHLRKSSDQGFANGLIEPGARELKIFRYYDRLGRLAAAEGWGWASRAISKYLDGIILGEAVDVVVLEQCDYGTEVRVRVDEVLREPAFPLENQTVRIRLVNGRRTNTGRIHNLSSEPKLKIGDPLLIGLSTVPASMWEMQVIEPCSDHLDLLYRTEIVAEEGFYELRNILAEPVVRDGQVQLDPVTRQPLNAFLVDLRDVIAHPGHRNRYPNEPPSSPRIVPPEKDRSRGKENSR